MNHFLMNSFLSFLVTLSLLSGGYAKTYYVAKTGQNSNVGTSADSAFLTIGQGIKFLAPGDSLLLLEGIYVESFFNDIPGGNSWEEPVYISGYGDQKVTIRPGTGQFVFNFSDSDSKYIILNSLVINALGIERDAIKITSGSDGAAHHIRIQNCEIMNAPKQGILVTNALEGVGHCEFIGLTIHDNGSNDFHHGIYIETAGNIVDNCEIYRNAGWGVHIYNESVLRADNNIIRNNKICNNASTGSRGPGIGIYSGKNNLVYNNLIWENDKGIEIGNDASGTSIFNNTIYGNQSYGIDLEYDCYDAQVINNLSFSNGADDINDDGVGSVLSNNLTDTNPLLQDPENGDFYPKSDSRVIDKGKTLTEFDTDANGRTRPNGSQWDIGAYEFYSDQFSKNPSSVRSLRIEEY